MGSDCPHGSCALVPIHVLLMPRHTTALCKESSKFEATSRHSVVTDSTESRQCLPELRTDARRLSVPAVWLLLRCIAPHGEATAVPLLSAVLLLLPSLQPHIVKLVLSY